MCAGYGVCAHMVTSSASVQLFDVGCLLNNSTFDQIRLLIARVVECVCSNQPIMFPTINKHFDPMFFPDGVDARKVYINPFKCSIKCTVSTWYTIIVRNKI